MRSSRIGPGCVGWRWKAVQERSPYGFILRFDQGEYSSGGKQNLLGITKRGNRRIRTQLILAANAFICGLNCRKKGENGDTLSPLNPLELWGKRLINKTDTFEAKVALANKKAAIIVKGEQFDVSKAIAA